MLFVYKLISFRKEILALNSETLEIIIELKSITVAMRYAKVNFYIMKNSI